MKVFLSWSGEQSRQMAEALHGWLRNVIQAIDPWVSSQDIDKGSLWASEIDEKLESYRAGICCITPDNQAEPWLNFEAGALAMKVGPKMVCPYLLGLTPVDLKSPLSKFQAAEANRHDTLELVRTLNKSAKEGRLSEVQLDGAFEKWWPELEERIKDIQSLHQSDEPRRNDRELLEELVLLTREVKATLDTHQSRSQPPSQRTYLQQYLEKIVNDQSVYQNLSALIEAWKASERSTARDNGDDDSESGKS